MRGSKVCTVVSMAVEKQLRHLRTEKPVNEGILKVVSGTTDNGPG